MSYYDDYSDVTPARQFPTGESMMSPQIFHMQQTIPMQQSIPLPVLPTGVPLDLIAPIPGAPVFPGLTQAQSMEPVQTGSSQYLSGYLKSQIGNTARVEFQIGNVGPLFDITGTLLDVQTSYIVIKPVESDDMIICDLYSVKFVNILH